MKLNIHINKAKVLCIHTINEIIDCKCSAFLANISIIAGERLFTDISLWKIHPITEDLKGAEHHQFIFGSHRQKKQCSINIIGSK